MAEREVPVVVDLVWSEPPSLTVEDLGDRLHVTAHAGLSEQQVRQACSGLDDHGEAVFEAWRGAVGHP